MDRFKSFWRGFGSGLSRVVVSKNFWIAYLVCYALFQHFMYRQLKSRFKQLAQSQHIHIDENSR